MSLEPEGTERSVFLSYSHRDASVVHELSLILRGGGASIWSDRQIDYGDAWRPTIAKSVDTCERLLVFWCRHSAKSSEVRNEYELALDRTKRVVPVRMDGTALPPQLSAYQAVDLSKFVWWHHELARIATILGALGAIGLLVGWCMRTYG